MDLLNLLDNNLIFILLNNFLVFDFTHFRTNVYWQKMFPMVWTAFSSNWKPIGGLVEILERKPQKNCKNLSPQIFFTGLQNKWQIKFGTRVVSPVVKRSLINLLKWRFKLEYGTFGRFSPWFADLIQTKKSLGLMLSHEKKLLRRTGLTL